MREIDNIKEIQGVLFDALCYFDEFCRKYDIKYYLSNGTLLGAAKYNGFIPWDDDVDVLVPREDYDKLMKLTEINNAQFKLFCREQVPEWRMPYAKLSCEDTIVKEGEYNFGAKFGLSVDIFPIDNWSPYLLFAKIQAFRGECLKRLFVCSIGGEFCTTKKGIKRLILKTIWFSGKVLGYRRISNSILRSVERAKKRKRKYQGCLTWTCHLWEEIFPAYYFEKTVFLTFCGRSFPVSVEYEQYLNNLYGNWRADLPPEQQHSNHDIKVWWKNAE